MPQQHRRILLLHDDAEQLGQIVKHLTALGHEVCPETRPANICALGAELRPDLFICNYDIPGYNISGLLSTMHKTYPLLRFIILTPQGRTLEVMRSMRNRIAAFLSHPFNMDDLEYYVRSVLNAGESGSNRREHSRYLFTLETHCVVINPFDNTEGRPIPALIRDVSRSGVSILVRQMLPVPALLKLIVHLDAQLPPVTLLAKSVSCVLTQINGVYRTGVKFIGLLPSQLAEIVLKVDTRNAAQMLGNDMYMGKSFADAVREWLNSHHAEGLLLPEQHPAEIAAEVGRVEYEHDEEVSTSLVKPGSANGRQPERAKPATPPRNGNGKGSNGHSHAVYAIDELDSTIES